MGHLRLLLGDGSERQFADRAQLELWLESHDAQADDAVFDEDESRWHLLRRVVGNVRESDPVQESGVSATPRTSKESNPPNERRPEGASLLGRGLTVKVVVAVVGLSVIYAGLQYSGHSTPTSGDLAGQRAGELWTAPLPAVQRTARCNAQNPDHLFFEPNQLCGRVANYGLGDGEPTGEAASFGIDLDVESASKGNLLIGPELGGSGEAMLMFGYDTLVIISVSPMADTIVWLAVLRDTIAEGSYRIVGGASASQGGRWWAGMSVSTRRRLELGAEALTKENIRTVLRLTMKFDRFRLVR